MIRKLQSIGWHGIAMLMLSTLIIFITCGLTYLALLVRILRVAVKSPAHINPCPCVVVPGMRLDNDKVNHEFKLRLDRVVSLNSSNSEKTDHSTLVFVLGGVTDGNNLSEAEAGANYLQSQGIKRQNIVLEEKSNNTLENFRFAKSLMEEKQTNETVVIVTTRYHLARCSIFASSLEIKHTLCGADSRFVPTLKNMFCVLMEGYNLHWHFTWWYWSVLTGNEEMLGRFR